MHGGIVSWTCVGILDQRGMYYVVYNPTRTAIQRPLYTCSIIDEGPKCRTHMMYLILVCVTQVLCVCLMIDQLTYYLPRSQEMLVLSGYNRCVDKISLGGRSLKMVIYRVTRLLWSSREYIQNPPVIKHIQYSLTLSVFRLGHVLTMAKCFFWVYHLVM